MCWGVTSSSDASSAARSTLVRLFKLSTKLMCGLHKAQIRWLGESPMRLLFFRAVVTACQTLEEVACFLNAITLLKIGIAAASGA